MNCITRAIPVNYVQFWIYTRISMWSESSYSNWTCGATIADGLQLLYWRTKRPDQSFIDWRWNWFRTGVRILVIGWKEWNKSNFKLLCRIANGGGRSHWLIFREERTCPWNPRHGLFSSGRPPYLHHASFLTSSASGRAPESSIGNNWPPSDWIELDTTSGAQNWLLSHNWFC